MNLAKLMLLQVQGIDSADAFPSSVSANITGAGTATTGAMTFRPKGGAGDFTYSTTCDNGVTVTSPSAQTTTYSKALSSGQTIAATATCRITAVANGDFIDVTAPVNLSSMVSGLSGTASGGASGSASAHTTTTVTSNSVTITPSGGTPGYAGSYISLPSGVTANSPTSLTSSFSADLGPQQSVSGNAVFRITDSGGQHFDVTVPISLANTGFSTLTATASGSATGTGSSGSTINVVSNAVTITPSGGQLPDGISYSVTGAISVDNPTSLTSTFSKLLGPGGTASGTATATVTSVDGQSYDVTFPVNLSNTGSAYVPVSVTADNSEVFGSGPNGGGTISAGPVTLTGHNGTGSYTESWARLSGATEITANSPGSATSLFTSTGQGDNSEIAAVFRGTVTDGTTSDFVDVTVDITKGTAP